MKVSIFQADKGDCLLVTGADGRRILVDGGMRDSFRRHVAPALGELQRDGEQLDLVCVSHIDEDHISGILQLMDDLVAWRVHDYQVSSGSHQHRAPQFPRPPEVRRIWHNAFHEQVGENAGPIADMLAATATILSGSDDGEVRALATANGDLAASQREGHLLSRRIGPRQLSIPLNLEFGGKLVFVREDLPPLDAARDGLREGGGDPEPAEGPPVNLGGLCVQVIGPFEADLERLRNEWNSWLKKNREALESIAREGRADEERLRASEIDRIILPALAQARVLGQRAQVTTPNLASLMLLVEEAGRTILLPGDGHADDIVKGVEHLGKLQGGRIHVGVLKVQHHGSEHNLHPAFCQKVTAEHYVFCANGEHHNPDLRVVEAIVDSRLNGDDHRRFKLWFNSSSAVTEKPGNKAHMTKVERLVRDRAEQSGGRMEYDFLQDGPCLELSL